MHHWSKQFEIPVLNGNLTITCLNNQSEINNTVTRLFAANNYSDNVLRDLQVNFNSKFCILTLTLYYNIYFFYFFKKS